eukprot:gene8272-11197_t
MMLAIDAKQPKSNGIHSSNEIITHGISEAKQGDANISNENINSSSLDSVLLSTKDNQHSKTTEESLKAESMKDEYGCLDCAGDTFVCPSFILESGVVMINVETRYNTFGKLNERKDNAILVCHALTGNSRLDQWWGCMLGDGKCFDTSKYFLVCANILGSCYGSTGPMSVNPQTGRIYGNSFPDVTIRDTVSLQIKLMKEHLGVSSVRCVIGGSMGGMQALEWAIMGEDFVRSSIIIGCGAKHSAWQIGISETQRQAIYADPLWHGGDIDPNNPPKSGLSVARQIAMISYRTKASYDLKFGREIDSKTGAWEVARYLEYQGKKFLDRFDALTYVKIINQMDTHDITRDRNDNLNNILSNVKCTTLVIGIDSDLLYPLSEQEELAKNIPNCQMEILSSPNGHDSFLIEQIQMSYLITEFLNRQYISLNDYCCEI